MSFDSRSLDKLRHLNQKIQNTQPLSIDSKNNSSKKKHNLHKVETEQDPHKLFHSLMDISPDGNVPTHLVSRLKELESPTLINSELNSINKSTNAPEPLKNTSSKNNASLKREEDNLYTSFKNLLLEEDL